ncbi:MAG: hypothetical protein Q4F11_02025 [Eubacteriales bacterium]|nr:hypothetical protein [Eubacteriales bacterium]
MYLLNNLISSKKGMETVISTLADMKIVCHDLRKELYNHGENQCVEDKTVGIILTKEMLLDCSYMYCLEVVHSLFKKRKMEVVTGLYGVEMEELPNRAQWLLKTCLLVIQCEADEKAFGYFCAGRILKSIYERTNNISGENQHIFIEEIE